MSRHPVLRMVKTLDGCPRASDSEQLQVRAFEGERDVETWVHLRNQVFNPGESKRSWTSFDFHREFGHRTGNALKDGLSTGMIWFAEPVEVQSPSAVTLGPIGTICCKIDVRRRRCTINWLAVIPEWRRKGVASHLLRTAERYSWCHGVRRLELSTLDVWHSAIAFYQHQGFRHATE